MQVPAPYSDSVTGCLIALSAEGPNLLLTGDIPALLPGETLHRGDCLLRYGFAYLYREEASLIPQWAMDDFRQVYSGVDALAFLREHGDTYPRGDVIGRALPEDSQAEAFIKELDLARPLRVFAWQPEGGLLARVHLAVWVDSAHAEWGPLAASEGPLPALLCEALPCYGMAPRTMDRLPEWALSVFM